MATVVEFVGIPGAGKSTLAAAVAAALEAEGRPVVTRPGAPSVARKVRSVVRYRDAVWAALHVLARSTRPMPQRVQALRLVISSLEQYDVADADPSDAVHLVGEGSLQRLFLLHVERELVRRAGWQRFVTSAPTADVVVLVDTPPAVVRERLGTRDRGLPARLVGLPGAELDDLLGESSRLFDDALRLLDGTHRGSVVRTADTGDAAVVLAALR